MTVILKNSSRSFDGKAVFHEQLQKLVGEVKTEHRFHPVRKWRFDYFIPRFNLAIELEGSVFTQGRHTRGAGFVKDLEKYNTALSMGIPVYRINSADIKSVKKLMKHVSLIAAACSAMLNSRKKLIG